MRGVELADENHSVRSNGPTVRSNGAIGGTIRQRERIQVDRPPQLGRMVNLKPGAPPS